MPTHFEGNVNDAAGLTRDPTGLAAGPTDDEIILQLFKDNIGKAINTGLVIAGQNNGQPKLVMDSVWSGSWFDAEAFIDNLLAEADTFQAALQRASLPAPAALQGPSTARIPESDPVHGRDFGGGGRTRRSQPFGGSEDNRGQRAGDGAGQTRVPAQRERTFTARHQQGVPAGAPTPPNSKFENGRDYYLLTFEGNQEMRGKVWEMYRGLVSFDIGDLDLSGAVPSGSGRRGFTAAEIRNRFDLDELTRQATNLFRTTLLTDDVDTRPMAKAYIDAVVASKGEKEINFIEFITKKIEGTDRYASIYRSKPKSMTTAQYLLPYFQAAQVAGPEAAAGVAIGGAQFGSDPATFNARLRRTDAVTSSSSFINELQSKFSMLNKVFKG